MGSGRNRDCGTRDPPAGMATRTGHAAGRGKPVVRVRGLELLPHHTVVRRKAHLFGSGRGLETDGREWGRYRVLPGR